MRQTNKPANMPDPADDPVPLDIDEFRLALARRISRIMSNRKEYWRGCRERLCRRQRACAAPRVRCSSAPVLPPDPARAARAMAQLQRALRKIETKGSQGKSDPGSGV